MKLLVAILIAVIPFNSFSQSARQYFDENANPLPGPEGASYYREITENGDQYIVNDFYASNGQLEMNAICSEVKPRLIYHGTYKSYHKNGQLKEDGSYQDGKRHGLWKSYYENGQQEDQVRYEGDKSLFEQHWDESGNADLVNGSGRYTKKYPAGDRHYEIEDHRLIASYSINAERGDTTYVASEEAPTYKDGMPALYQEISKNMRYPVQARRKGIQGMVYVEFTVDKDGKVRDVKTIKGPHPILNEEAERVIGMMNKGWTPGKVKGGAVARKMVLPVAFKLG